MILVYGRHDDPPTGATMEALRARGSRFAFLDQAALHDSGIDLHFEVDGAHGRLSCNGESIDIRAIRAAFVRPLEVPRPDVVGQDWHRAMDLHAHLIEWLDATPARVINRPAAMQSNASKSLQLQLIGAAGFRVPETLVTSDPGEARAFWRHHGRVIYKSISGIRSIVRELDDDSAARLDSLQALPVQFQARIPGVDVRVHVVGREVFAAEIRSEAIDYRYAARDNLDVSFSTVELPVDVAGRCIAVAACLGLPLAGIDLRRQPNGEHVCFEVNPMPAYSYFESNTGLPIADAIARLLDDAVAPGREEHDGPGSRELDHPPRSRPVTSTASHAGYP